MDALFKIWSNKDARWFWDDTPSEKSRGLGFKSDLRMRDTWCKIQRNLA